MRLLHVMLRVVDLERSIAFYTEVLGMRLLRRSEYPQGRFTLAFVGYGEEKDNAVIELTWNWDTDHYEIGGGYGHWGMQHDVVVHVGLGSNCAIDSVKVRWPDAAGTTETWNHVRANYLVRLEQGKAQPSYPLYGK